MGSTNLGASGDHRAHPRALRPTRVEASPRALDDEVVVEEPLEIRIAGETLAVTMRTPGHDRELVLGFLWSERLIASLKDVAAIAHCGRPGDAAFGNTIEVTPAPGVGLAVPDDPLARRGTITTSACGVCGRRSIDDLLARCAPVASGARMPRGAVTRAVDTLASRQPLFARTGGCHAASLATLQGEHVATFEDVGRHNAVDKAVGHALLAASLPAAERALVVSGRTSFEIVQKAVAAGVPIVVGVSASSSLAVDLARRAGVTLLGFARRGDFVVYAGGDRIAEE
jgi:FdhD protein